MARKKQKKQAENEECGRRKTGDGRRSARGEISPKKSRRAWKKEEGRKKQKKQADKGEKRGMWKNEGGKQGTEDGGEISPWTAAAVAT